jgi:hypothetical protein
VDRVAANRRSAGPTSVESTSATPTSVDAISPPWSSATLRSAEPWSLRRRGRRIQQVSVDRPSRCRCRSFDRRVPAEAPRAASPAPFRRARRAATPPTGHRSNGAVPSRPHRPSAPGRSGRSRPGTTRALCPRQAKTEARARHLSQRRTHPSPRPPSCSTGSDQTPRYVQDASRPPSLGDGRPSRFVAPKRADYPSSTGSPFADRVTPERQLALLTRRESLLVEVDRTPAVGITHSRLIKKSRQTHLRHSCSPAWCCPPRTQGPLERMPRCL